MPKRMQMNRGSSQRLFTRTASNVHPRNSNPRPMRGGFRL